MIFADEYDIQIEFGDLGNILAYLSIGDRSREIERLVSSSEIPAALRQGKGRFDEAGNTSIPELPFLPRMLFMRKRNPFR